ncbi:uncharacterized protein LOC126778119 [Nymphalis io]|uniref:uncharacterized protein LOC126778119 n=1 Tax=Inachis io TaxID=171585 RepID=UPI0021676712|nr:uncharacterized protein LOC126778119 [Nymphalis io]
MDYVVGSVAALISGNVTPNRPKKFKKANTPMKHQPSPNVTPKSEFVEDRSIFLSPSMQKKKAIVKKSPKRIFENPDLDVTKEDEGNLSLTSPKADKVKKHLKEELEANCTVDQVMLSPKSPDSEQENLQSSSPKKKIKMDQTKSNDNLKEITPKKKKKQRNSIVESQCLLPLDENVMNNNDKENLTKIVEVTPSESPKKKNKKSNVVTEAEVKEPDTNTTQDEKQKSKKKKKKKSPQEKPETETLTNILESQSPKKKNKKNKKLNNTNGESENTDININAVSNKDAESKAIKNKQKPEAVKNALESQSPKKKNKKMKLNNTDVESENLNINSNAVTNKDTDSEHESDNEIESENEEINKKALETAPAEDSSDDEAEKPAKPKKVENKKEAVATEEEIKRTIFVGNVPFSSKCKKEIKKIFSQYGLIETVRIRTVPVKDARVTPKMAVIKNELHPDRSTVNVYVKYADTTSVDKALAANNTVLNDHHLRVSRSDTTGAAHDPKCSVFVGNIPFALEDETLRAKFEKCGDIESVRIIRDKKTNAGKGFGYINFASKDGVELALALTEEDLTIKNRIMRVKRCTQAAQRNTGKPDRRIQGQVPGNQFARGRFPDKQSNDERSGGAYRRVMNKRRHQDGNDGPPNKRQNMNQPHKEKKTRKEFVGITAEKKKKQKFNKGLKKKKALSEILTK